MGNLSPIAKRDWRGREEGGGPLRPDKVPWDNIRAKHRPKRMLNHTRNPPENKAHAIGIAAFLLTVGSFLLTVELFYLQLTTLAFLLTVGAFLLTILAFLLTIGAFVLGVGKCA